MEIQVQRLRSIQFLNTWNHGLQTNDDDSYLLPAGAAQETDAGAQFWQARGRLLFNATLGQPFYNSTSKNGSELPKLLFRTTDESRIMQGTRGWANGMLPVQRA